MWSCCSNLGAILLGGDHFRLLPEKVVFLEAGVFLFLLGSHRVQHLSQDVWAFSPSLPVLGEMACSQGSCWSGMPWFVFLAAPACRTDPGDLLLGVGAVRLLAG